MSKRYSDQLGEWVKQKQSRKRDKNLVAFLAIKADVQEALNEGYAAKTIWAHMLEKKRIEFGYDTFLNYTNRQIRRHLSSATSIQDEQNTASKDKTNELKKDTTKPQQPGFTFDSSPKKEDYL
ncbi:MAG: TraK family protein [Methylomonas lenta]|jgi:hypothetical protein|nr:TraK family protein [Methylomonas lenta]